MRPGALARILLAGVGFAGVVFGSPAVGQIRSVTLVPPARDFGYFVGDLLASRAVIDVGPDTGLDARTLPVAGPVGPSADVRSVTVSEMRVAGGRRVVVDVVYQSFESPGQVSRAAVPGYAVGFRRGGALLTAAVPGFGFAVSPFRHDLQPVLDAGVLRPDHAVGLMDVSAARRALVGGCVAALLALTVLAFGSLGLAGRGSPPFAVAARQIARAGRRAPDKDGLLALHRAFDETAGRRVFADDLAEFFASHSEFAGLRGEVEGFFAASRAAFFGEGGATAVPSLFGLSRALARVERR